MQIRATFSPSIHFPCQTQTTIQWNPSQGFSPSRQYYTRSIQESWSSQYSFLHTFSLSIHRILIKSIQLMVRVSSTFSYTIHIQYKSSQCESDGHSIQLTIKSMQIRQLVKSIHVRISHSVHYIIQGFRIQYTPSPFNTTTILVKSIQVK